MDGVEHRLLQPGKKRFPNGNIQRPDPKLGTERRSWLRGSVLSIQKRKSQKMYYRIAIQVDASPTWQWKSTVLSSLDTLFQFLRLLRALPQDQLRVFSSSSREGLSEQLVQENQGLITPSVTAAHFLHERLLCSPAMVRDTAEREGEAHRPMAAIAARSQPSVNEYSRGVNAPEGRGMSALESRRAELESGVGGDHDLPYRFTGPSSMPQVLAWTKLLVRVQVGELQP
jgi:hypothetical protein